MLMIMVTIMMIITIVMVTMMLVVDLCGTLGYYRLGLPFVLAPLSGHQFE